jgi:excisionase family DNA binding protein
MDIERPATPEPWITAEEAAAHLGYTVGSFYNKIADGSGIPHRKIAGRFRFRRSELDAWVEAQHAGSQPAETAS